MTYLALWQCALRWPRSLAPREVCKVEWAVAMSAANYGIEAIWTRQPWLLKGFDKQTATIARAVAGTFSTVKAKDAIRGMRVIYHVAQLLV